jgi:lipopolysaccharide transport system ATP-binding protein
MRPTVIAVQNLSKKYTLDLESYSSGRVKNLLRWPFKIFRNGSVPQINHHIQKVKKKEFWALKNISFDVKKGERIGIIGRNGAGKSTLLKILSRISFPTEGQAIISGKVTSLLEVGTGFNPNLTGRENIFLNASMYGLSKQEISARFDEIVTFSELKEDFLLSPIKYYSSGMRMRLAFSIAAHLDPDILMLDEVLTVGDLAFSRKCLHKVEGMTDGGHTLLFVSHSIGNILKFCDKVIWLDGGKIQFYGDVVEGVQLYQEAMSPKGNETILEHRTERTGSGRVFIEKIALYDGSMQPVESFRCGEDMNIVLRYRCDTQLLHPEDTTLSCCLYVENSRAQRLFGTPDFILSPRKSIPVSRNGQLRCTIKRLPLLPDIYNLSFTVTVGSEKADKLFQSRTIVVREGDFYGSGELPHSNCGPFCVDYGWDYLPHTTD